MSTVHGGPSAQDGPPVLPATGRTVGAGTAAGPAAEPSGPASSVAVGQQPAPVRAAGVQLIGEAKGSGYKEAPSLVRRADGQTIQLTRLLFHVLDSIDGVRDVDEIAE